MMMKILVVDDDPDQLQTIVRQVQGILHGWKVETASTFEEAKGKIASDTNVVISDYHLGQQMRDSGVDLLRHAQEVAPDCYRILVSNTAERQPDLTGDNLMIHKYVSLRYINKNPIAMLRDVLQEAERSTKDAA